MNSINIDPKFFKVNTFISEKIKSGRLITPPAFCIVKLQTWLQSERTCNHCQQLQEGEQPPDPPIGASEVTRNPEPIA